MPGRSNCTAVRVVKPPDAQGRGGEAVPLMAFRQAGEELIGVPTMIDFANARLRERASVGIHDLVVRGSPNIPLEL